MRFSRTTRFLAVMAIFLSVLVFVPSSTEDGALSLPSLPALDKSAINRISITLAGQTTILEKESDTWRIVQPLTAEADDTSIRGILTTFRKGVPMEVRVDKGNLETYGLDDNKGIAVDFFTSSGAAVASMVVGFDMPGGTSFVRLPGSEEVFRARVGGRFRYEREPTEWRNHDLLKLAEADVERLDLIRPTDTLTFLREDTGETDKEGTRRFSDWRLAQDPSLPVDQKGITGLVRLLTQARASVIHAPDYGTGWDSPAAILQVGLVDGTSRSMAFVAESAQVALCRVDDKPDVFQIAASTLARLVLPRADYRDRSIFRFRMGDIDTMSLLEPNTRIRLRQDLATNMWSVIEPLNMDTDFRVTIQAAKALSDLQADRVVDGVTLAQAGLDRPAWRIVVALLDGTDRALEVGGMWTDPSGTTYHYIKRQGDDQIFLMKQTNAVALRRAFLQN